MKSGSSFKTKRHSSTRDNTFPSSISTASKSNDNNAPVVSNAAVLANEYASSNSGTFAIPAPQYPTTSTPTLSVSPAFGSSSSMSRKRMMMDNDETNNSQAAGSTTSSGVSSTVDIDSMRPVAAPRTKRRRTGILDAFNSISLVSKSSRRKNMPQEGNLSLGSCFRFSHSIPDDQGNDDADSSQAVAESDNVENSGDYYSSSGSSLGDESCSIEAENDMKVAHGDEQSTNSDFSDGLFLSDAELVVKKEERKVMLELVFGPNSEFVPRKDPVDVKLKQLILKSMQDSKPDMNGTKSPPVDETAMDDTDIESKP